MNTQSPKDRPEWLVADNVTEATWLRLRRLSSTQLCTKLIRKLHPALATDVLERKARGTAWAVRSALGYWETQSGGLNSKVLSRYYALLHISIAEEVAHGGPNTDLANVQRHTEQGHGLFSYPLPGKDFPESYFIGCLNSGHFPTYCKAVGVDLGPYCHARRPRGLTDLDQSKGYTLSQLVCRIPELQKVVSEFLDQKPLSFHVAHAQRNLTANPPIMPGLGGRRGSSPPPPPAAKKLSYVAIYADAEEFTAEDLNALGLPIKNIYLETAVAHSSDHFVGEVEHSHDTQWYSALRLYKSGYSGSSLILPFWGTDDVFILHLAVLYAFSIVVRYLPETWQQIEGGSLDNVRALLEHYLVVVDNVLPALAVERLTRRGLLVVSPGSLRAPI